MHEHPRRSFLAINAVGVQHAGINRRAFDYGTFRREIAARKSQRAGQTSSLRLPRRQDDVLGIHSVLFAQNLAEPRAALGCLPPVQDFAQCLAAHGWHIRVQRADSPQMQHHFRHAARQKDAHGGMMPRAVRQDIDDARHAAVDGDPVFDRRTRQPGGVGDGRDVQQQIGGAAERGVHSHRVANARRPKNVAHGDAARFELAQRAPRTHRDVRPDRLSRRGQRRVRERHPQSLAYDLRCRGSAQELAAAARRGAGATAQLGRLLQRDQSMREPHAKRLDFPGIFSFGRRQRDPARHQHARQIAHRRQRHHHCRQTLVARRHADDSRTRRQRTNEPAEYLRGVVAIRQAVEHAGRTLRAAIARVGTKRGEGNRPQGAQLLGRRLNQQADFPMTGVIAQRDRSAVRRAETALSAENEKLFAAQFARVPAHASVLRESKNVAARPVQQHVRR